MRLATSLLALLVALFGALPAAHAAERREPKVVLVVGPAGGATDRYRAQAEQAALVAERYTRNVVRLYSPAATWPAVRNALQGAAIVVYLGHGNGWPSRYRDSLYGLTQNGFGLNPVAGGGDDAHQYFGESRIAADVELADNAIVLLHHLCYASGNTEPGLPEGTVAQARQRVDNYAAGFIRAGAGAVVAEGHLGPAWYMKQLFAGSRSIDRIWRASPNARGHEFSFESSRSAGYVAAMDPDAPTSGFFRSIVYRGGVGAGRLATASPEVAAIPAEPAEPTLIGTGLSITTPYFRGRPVIGGTTHLWIPYVTEDAASLKGLTVGVRWDPLDPATTQVGEATGTAPEEDAAPDAEDIAADADADASPTAEGAAANADGAPAAEASDASGQPADAGAGDGPAEGDAPSPAPDAEGTSSEAAAPPRGVVRGDTSAANTSAGEASAEPEASAAVEPSASPAASDAGAQRPDARATEAPEADAGDGAATPTSGATAAASADPTRTPEPTARPERAERARGPVVPAPELLPAPAGSAESEPLGPPDPSTGTFTSIEPERLGSLVQPVAARVGKTRIVVALTLPEQPGRYRLVTTLHDASGVAYDAATQELLPRFIVDVSANIDASYLVTKSATVRAGSSFDLPVAVANTGSRTWGQPGGDPRAGLQAPRGATVQAHWLALHAASSDAALPGGASAALRPALPAGGNERVVLPMRAPVSPGTYLIVLDVVVPGIGSLTAQGVEPALVRVTVE